jgi:hypothetical protein
MPFAHGHYTLGPDTGTLSVRTKKAGAASKAGHNLLIEVQAWSATLDVGEDGAGTAVSLAADSRSLKVLEGTGGISALDDGDKAGIAQTIDEEVLKGTAIAFHSTSVEGGTGSESLRISGELELAGRSHPVTFELRSDAAGTVSGAAIIKQTDWGMKPYSALFGTLKVVDEVTVEVTARLPADT